MLEALHARPELQPAAPTRGSTPMVLSTPLRCPRRTPGGAGLRDREAVLTFLDDVYVVAPPERVEELYAAVEEALCGQERAAGAGANVHHSIIVAQATRRKRRKTYPELGRARRCRLVVFGIEVGGGRAPEAATFVRLLPHARAAEVPASLRPAARAAWVVRWSGLQRSEPLQHPSSRCPLARPAPTPRQRVCCLRLKLLSCCKQLHSSWINWSALVGVLVCV